MMTVSLSSLPVVLLLSAGVVLTSCGNSDLATALPALDSATLVTSTAVEPVPEEPPFFSDLDLTEAQRTQAEQIHQQRMEQTRAVLTAKQVEILDTFRAEQDDTDDPDPQTRQELRQQLNATEDQQEQIKAIREEAREQFRAILTPEQLELLDERKAQREEAREQFRGSLSPEQLQRLEELEAERSRVING